MKRFIWVTILIIVLSTSFVFVQDRLATATVIAQESTPTDNEVNAIAKDLFCPVCENTPLDVCPTDACKEWREEIRGMLADGKSEEEIKQHFVDYYGARVLSEPPRTGFNWLVYVVPPIVIVAGAFVLFRAFRAWSQPSESETEVSADEEDALPSPDDEYIARMEEELKKRK